MFRLMVGVGHVSLLFRHARSLKDKRQILKSITQKLRNQGFSVTESGFSDEPKRGSLGFSYVANNPTSTGKAMDDAMKLFVGDFEVLETKRDVFDYSGEGEETVLSEEEDLKYGL